MRIILLVFSLFFALNLSASTASDAEEAYHNKEWKKAELLYAKLLVNSPSNRIYNHRYGVVLYEQNKDFSKAENHLLKAKNQGITLSYYYLGRVCFLQYKFDDAINYYKAFLAKSNTKDLKELTSKKHLPASLLGQDIISRTEDIEILDKVVVDRKDFFLEYKFNKEVGSFIKDASKIGEDSTSQNSSIFITERGDRTFFAVNENGNTNLYSKNKLLNQWADKTSLGETINSDQDEVFPFLMSDGIVFYFSSNGHNSLGGLDIFITRYNTANNSYLPPQQLGMPFNSPNDDILLAIDEYNKIGWFASDRDCKEGKIAIYTFVPNEYVKLLDNSNTEMLIKAAKAETITPKDSLNTIEIASTATVDANNNVVKTLEGVSHKIYFIVNDTLIYTSMTDFMSKEARDMYINYENTCVEYDSTLTTINILRKEYSGITDANKKATMIAEIMKLENHSYALEEVQRNHLHNTQRLELEAIMTNGGYDKNKNIQAFEQKLKETIEEKELNAKIQAFVANDTKVSKPFFYNKTLNAYYNQIYTSTAIEKLIDARQITVNATNRQLISDYAIKEYYNTEKEDNFAQLLWTLDTTITMNLSPTELNNKVNNINDEIILQFIKSNYLSFYTLKGQNTILLESVKNEKYHEEIKKLINRADFELLNANQNIYTSEGVYSYNKEKLSAGNRHLKDGISFLEVASLTYLKYCYEDQKKIAAKKQQPEENKVIAKESKPVQKNQVEKITEVEKPVTNIPKSANKIEYRIQFGVFSRMLKESEIKLKQLSFVQLSEKQLYKFFSGHYNSQTDAAKGLEEVKSLGFKDAFIVKFVNGKIE